MVCFSKTPSQSVPQLVSTTKRERKRERTKIMLTESVRIAAGNSKAAHNLAFLFIEKLQSRKFKLDIEQRSG